MKKQFCILSLFVIICSCVGHGNGTDKILANSSMDEVIIFFYKYIGEENKAGNNILKKEIFGKREKELMSFIDSAAILTNLKGKIDKINIKESQKGNSSLLEYKIVVSPGGYFKLTLTSRHIIDKDSLDSDYLYNKVKTMANNSTVYFDGIFSVNAEKNLPRTKNSSSDSYAFTYPDYFFHIVEISPEKNDTLSDDLKETLHIGRDCMNYLFAKYRKEKYKYPEKEHKKQLQIYEEYRKRLSIPESNYAKRYMNQIALDLY